MCKRTFATSLTISTLSACRLSLSLDKLSPPVVAMARNPPFKVPYRHRGSRSSASSNSNHGNGTRRTSASTNTSRRTSVRSASTLHARPNRACAQISRGSFPADTSLDALSGVNEDADGNDDTLNEVIMAVDLTPQGTVGCCYYIAREEQLYFMEDIQCGGVDVVDARECFVGYRMPSLLTSLSEDIHRPYRNPRLNQN